MRMHTWSAGLLACLVLSVIEIRPAQAVDGTIDITGSVLASTCQVAGTGTGSAKSIAVALPAVQASALAAQGEVAARTGFSIVVSNCAASLTTALTYFEPGPNVDMTTNNLKPSSGTATGVEVQLLNGSGGSVSAYTPILLGQSQSGQNSAVYQLSGNGATLNYYAQYYATAAATAGTFSSSVQFTMIYQ